MVDVSAKPQVLAVIGPTASGKSAVAMTLAERTGGEIIACDSVQVYRGFDIGSAKATPQEQARVPHHLVDVVDGHGDFDAQRYVERALDALARVTARGKTAIICGGTGLYLRALRYGLAQNGGSDPAIRAALQAEEAAHPGSLFRRLQSLDPVTAERTEPNNLVHVIRAVEICLITGEPASVVRGRHGFARPQVSMQVLSLHWPAEVLRARIVARAHAMVGAGLINEVERLLGQGISPTCRPMRAVGYKEALETMQGAQPLATLAERIAHSTWQYARRQRTWLRREPDMIPVAMG